MRRGVLLLLALLLSVAARAAEPSISVELNIAEAAEQRCRLTFVIANKGERLMESLKLDLALFNPEGLVQRRMVTEMAPVRPAKTVVRTFAVDGECAQISAVLVNEVAACVPGTPDSCLDDITLSSRAKGIRFYK
jgi:hypothetical protein